MDSIQQTHEEKSAKKNYEMKEILLNYSVAESKK